MDKGSEEIEVILTGNKKPVSIRLTAVRSRQQNLFCLGCAVLKINGEKTPEDRRDRDQIIKSKKFNETFSDDEILALITETLQLWKLCEEPPEEKQFEKTKFEHYYNGFKKPHKIIKKGTNMNLFV